MRRKFPEFQRFSLIEDFAKFVLFWYTYGIFENSSDLCLKETLALACKMTINLD